MRRARGLDIRQTRRWAADDLAPGPGVPRSRTEVAAIRAALWARSDRQAALVLTMAVQQGLVTAEALGREMLRVRRDRRRALVHAVLLDLLGGVRSLGELGVARECRRRGLPEPSRQVLRRGRNGTYYLDVTLQHATVLRLPLLGLRIAADAFFEQIEQALRAAGCPLSPQRHTVRAL